ncbi:MAG: 4Fe-4S binding protein [Armatimonadota bacterium]|nr:4Fe-4S binding protein [Armatimonadota bacterium]
MKRVRRIIKIDEDLCNGCGKCVSACVEGAIQLVDGKARLVSESYCDGLGACIGECPQGAITIEEREAEEFDSNAVLAHGKSKHSLTIPAHNHSLEGGIGHVHPDGTVCPSARSIDRRAEHAERSIAESLGTEAPSELVNWPIKLHLVNPRAPFLQDAHLLIAADCTAFAYGAFHSKLLRGKVLLTACPKFDNLDSHLEKLGEILLNNNVLSVTVVKMEVPCCSGIVRLAEVAIKASGKHIPLETVTVSLSGEILAPDHACCSSS